MQPGHLEQVVFGWVKTLVMIPLPQQSGGLSKKMYLDFYPHPFSETPSHFDFGYGLSLNHLLEGDLEDVHVMDPVLHAFALAPVRDSVPVTVLVMSILIL